MAINTLAIGYAMQARYDEAIAVLYKAIKSVVPKSYDYEVLVRTLRHVRTAKEKAAKDQSDKQNTSTQDKAAQ